MAETLTAKISVQLQYTHINDVDPQTTEEAKTVKLDFSLANGSGANAVSQMFRDRRTVAPGTTTDDIDLAGVLTNFVGATITFTEIKAIIIHNRNTASGDFLLVGAASPNALSPLFNGDSTAQLRVGPGSPGVLCDLVDGYTVTAGGQDVLRIEHGGSANVIEYDIYILGNE